MRATGKLGFDQIDAGRITFAHPRGSIEIPAQRHLGHIGDKRLIAKQDGFGNRQNLGAQLRRANRPATSKPGGGKGFRDRGHDNCATPQCVDFKRGGKGALKNQVLINLVTDNPKIMLTGNFTKVSECRRLQQGTRWIVRGVEQQNAAVFGDRGAQVTRLHDEAIFNAQRNGLKHPTRCPDNPGIGRIVRIADKNTLPRIDQCGDHGIKGGLGAGKAQDIVRCDIGPAGFVFIDNGTDQPIFATAIGIMGATAPHGGFARVDQGRINRNVGLANRKLDDFFARCPAVTRGIVDSPFRTPKFGETVGNCGISHETSLCGCWDG